MGIDIFDRLIISKQLSFTEGSIELFGSHISMMASEHIASYMYGIEGLSEEVQEFYRSSKEAVAEGIGTAVCKKYNFDPAQSLKIFTDLTEILGFGSSSWTPEKEGSTGTVHIGNSACKFLVGQATTPSDHYMRGIIAGYASALYRLDIDAIELNCIALESERCEFVYGERDKLMERYPEICRYQLGVLDGPR